MQDCTSAASPNSVKMGVAGLISGRISVLPPSGGDAIKGKRADRIAAATTEHLARS
jgi:hypothetical protein